MCWKCQQKQCQYSWKGEGYKKFHSFPIQQCWLQQTRNHFFAIAETPSCEYRYRLGDIFSQLQICHLKTENLGEIWITDTL